MRNKPTISLKRAFQLAWKNFHREGGISFVAVFVLVVVITFSVSLFFGSEISKILIEEVEQRADVSIDFGVAVPEEAILEIKEEIAREFEVTNVTYVSREEVKNNFIQRFGDRPDIMESLEEVGNPFPASLNIKASEPYTYRQIVSYLEDNHKESVYDISDYYHRREEVIETIFGVTENVRRGGVILAFILGFIAVVLVYNTIKITIYGLREEIKIMRLVGSSNLFIRSSFIIQGTILGVVASLASFIIFLSIGLFIPEGYYITNEINLQNYFFEMLPVFALIQFAIGIILGVFSSLVATGNYLK